MKKYGIFSLITVITVLFYPGTLKPEVSLQDENNSNVLCSKFTDEINNDSSEKYFFYHISKLLDIAPFTGRRKMVLTFKEAVKKLEEKEDKKSIKTQILRLLTDELEGNYTESSGNFTILKKWNVSVPWKRYGELDLDNEFQPEQVFRIEDIEKGENLLAGEEGELFPFKISHNADETAYITCAFTCKSGINLWIISDAKYRLIINGKDVSRNYVSGKKEIKAFTLKGAKAYSLQIKMQVKSLNHYPYLRAMITDENNSPVKLDYSSNIFHYSFTAEKLFSLYENIVTDTCEAGTLTERMSELVQSGNFHAGYKVGVSVIERFPSYSKVYDKFFPLLDLLNREGEFLSGIEKFRKIFPDSDIYLKWLAEFYMTRDTGEFFRIMKIIPPWYVSGKPAEVYLYLLCGEKKYSEAIGFCSFLKQEPRLKLLIPQIMRESGDNDSWRKALFSGVAGRDGADYYYDIGLAEKFIGLDPVMYWEKGYTLGSNFGLLRDISDLFENGILVANDYYSGVYTDLHPEFKWNAKKRKISIHILESGRVFFEGEDIIPSANEIQKMKYSESSIEFSKGEIKTDIPCIKGLKVLYVLSARDGLPAVINFKSEISEKKRYAVKYKITGDEEFFVIKYSGEYVADERDIFNLAKGLILKNENEKISELDYEVIFKGDPAPVVSYKSSLLPMEKSEGGIVKYISKERFAEDDSGNIVSDIFRFSSDEIFAAWYGKIISFTGKCNKKVDVVKNRNTKDILKEIYYFIMTGISKSGEITFSPDIPESVLQKKRGTVEERTLLAKAILENNGIKSFISFKKNKEGLIDKILLYIPESRARGFWLDFNGENLLRDPESGTEAIIITTEGYEKIPINLQSYIR